MPKSGAETLITSGSGFGEQATPNDNRLSPLAGYLNQDWDRDYPTEDDAIDAFIAESDSEGISSVLSGIDALLSLNLSDDELDRAVFCEGIEYRSNAMPANQWIREVRNRLADALKAT